MTDGDFKKNSDLLRLTEDDLHKIIKYSPDSLFIHVKGKICYVNDSTLKMFGATSADQMLGKSIWNIYPAEIHGLVRSRVQEVLTDVAKVMPFIQMKIVTLNGTSILVNSSNMGITYQGDKAVLVIMRDVTHDDINKNILKLQLDISNQLNTNESLVNVITFSLKNICATFKIDIGKVWVLDTKTNLLDCITTWAKSSFVESISSELSMKPNPSPINDISFCDVFYTGEPVWNITDNSEDESKTKILITLKHAKSNIGIMELISKHKYLRDDKMLIALTKVCEQLGTYIKRKIYEKGLIYISNHDPVTGLINRYLFEQTLDSEIKLAINNDQNLAVVFLEINNFRMVNASLGHLLGDQLLRMIAERIILIGYNIDHTSRIENDQFAIILHNPPNVAFIIEEINEITKVMAKKFELLDEAVTISINMGVAMFPDDGIDVPNLMKSAGIALAFAKQTGSGVFQFSNLELTDSTLQAISMENELHEALSNNELSLHYQPIVDHTNMVVVGFEALLRWHRHGVSVPTNIFIPVLEKMGLFIIIGEWIVRTACEQCKKWQVNPDKPVYVSVNLSLIEFQSHNLMYMLTTILEETELTPNLLVLELTESTLMHNTEYGVKVAEKIKAHGMRLAIDDFGSGYSSLNYLSNLPMHFVKLDKLFVDKVCSSSKVAAIVKATIDLSKALDYQIIAEGVETQEQLTAITKLGCRYIQGFYYSRPIPADETLKFVTSGDLSLGS